MDNTLPVTVSRDLDQCPLASADADYPAALPPARPPPTDAASVPAGGGADAASSSPSSSLAGDVRLPRFVLPASRPPHSIHSLT